MFFFYAGYLSMYGYASFMVVASALEDRNLCMEVSIRLENTTKEFITQHE
jgi:hypothetical protein